MSEKIIEFKDFSFQYDSQAKPTLKHINLSIHKGEKIAIVGPSGSGKSSLVHCLNGVIPQLFKGAMTGSASIGGRDLKSQSLYDLSFLVSTVLQDTDGQFIGLSVGEDIAFALENDAIPQAEMLQDVEKWAQEVDIVTHLGMNPQQLSGGQKQRVSMAGVLVNESPILLFDEPLANLDPHAGQKTIELIEDFHQKSDTTILIIEHRLEDVLYRRVDRILLMANGEIIADEKPDTLLKSSILGDNGIREPFYVSALKYANVPLENVSNLASLDELAVSPYKKAIEKWQSENVQVEKIEDKTSLLELKNISYKYPRSQLEVLHDISFLVNKGEMISLVGTNGAGKSTIAKAICGFIATTGEYFLDCKNMENFSIKERAQHIGFVMQNPNQMISKAMIFDEVALGLHLRGMPESEVKARVEETLKICGLYPFRNWPISALSYGQKKRVTIASIFALRPEIIILDEPTAGQDYKNYSEMMRFLEELNAQGTTIIMITHDMHLMLEYTQRCLVLDSGRIIADKPPAEVLTDEEIIKKAHLKETSLFTLAKKLGLKDPKGYVSQFISYDRKVHNER